MKEKRKSQEKKRLENLGKDSSINQAKIASSARACFKSSLKDLDWDAERRKRKELITAWLSKLT